METKEKPNKETLDRWHDDPANWKWGVFYYNEKDKRIFPPKRLKVLGWTVNFANPYSYLALLAILIFSIIIIQIILNLN